jgi:cytochrome c553
MAKPRVKVPKSAKAGEVITIKTLISHKMESGAQGQGRQHHPAQDHQQVHLRVQRRTGVRMRYRSGNSANPYFEFNAKVNESGTFKFTGSMTTDRSTPPRRRSKSAKNGTTVRRAGGARPGSRAKAREETMKKQLTITAAAFAAVTLASASSLVADPVDEKLTIDGKEMVTKTKAPEGHPFDEVLSGWLFRTSETRALEMDTFSNPAMLGVEAGEAMWNKVEGSAGKSCASCHGDAAESMKGVGASYPKWDEKTKRPINIELQINRCREENMGAEPLKFDKGGQKELTAYIKHQSLGMPVKIDLSPGRNAEVVGSRARSSTTPARVS